MRGKPNCNWGCEQRSKVGDGFSIVNGMAEAIRRALRIDEPDRPKKEFRIDGRIMRGDGETWQAELPENASVSQDDLIDVETSLLQPVIDNLVSLITKDERGEHNDLKKIRRASANLSVLAKAFERVAANGGAITDSDREAINQGISGILQLAFYSDLKQSE